ncbi:RING finger protein 32-like isoform X5 [Lampetra fluviatilis]
MRSGSTCWAPERLRSLWRLCLVPAPQGAALSQEEWRFVKSRSAQRDLFSLPCVICRDELGAHTQVLLSCSHVFHQGCVEALERVARCRRCPVCRVSPYEARVVHEASRLYRHKCATRLQAWWRGVSARVRFRRLRESVPPRDPALRRRFYENKLLVLGERLVRACDSGVDAFLREMEVERERRAQQSEGASASWDWERIEATVLTQNTPSHTHPVTHTVTHTPPHTHTLSHTPSHTHPVTHTVTHTPPHTHTLSHTVTHTPCHTPSHTHTPSHIHTVHPLTHTPRHTHPVTHTVTHSHSHTVILSHCHTPCHTHRHTVRHSHTNTPSHIPSHSHTFTPSHHHTSRHTVTQSHSHTATLSQQQPQFTTKWR